MEIKLLMMVMVLSILNVMCKASPYCPNGTYRDYTFHNELGHPISIVLYETTIGRYPFRTIRLETNQRRGKYCSPTGGGWNQVAVARANGHDLCEASITNNKFVVTVKYDGGFKCQGNSRP